MDQDDERKQMSKDFEIEARIKSLFQADDPKALDLLYDHLGKRLYGYLISLTSSATDAEELLSELFLRIVKKKKQIGKVDKMRMYIFTMARNLVHESYRNRERDKNKLAEYTNHIELREHPSFTWDDNEIEGLNNAFATLPTEQREVIVMKIHERMTFAEISEILRTSLNTVASRYRYALDKLRMILKEGCHER